MATAGRPQVAPEDKKISKSITATQAIWERVAEVAKANRWPLAVAASVLIEEGLNAREKTDA